MGVQRDPLLPGHHFPQNQRLPTHPRERAHVDRWLYWQSFHLLNTVIAARDKGGDGQKDVDLYIGLLNSQLDGKEYVVGELSLADFAIAPYLLGRHGQAIDYTPFPNVMAWLDRCNALKGMIETAFKPTGAKEL